MALIDSTTTNTDKGGGGFFSGLVETLGSAVNAVIPAAAGVAVAKLNADAAKASASANPTTETGRNVQPAAPAAIDWKSPGVLIGAGLVILLTVALLFRRR